MDIPVEVVVSRLAQEWDGLMWAFWAGLTWTAVLGTLAVAVGSLVATSGRTLRSRRFWCPAMGQDVQVLFEEWGPPGLRQVLGVRECSIFEPARAIACRRDCRDTTCRRLAAPMGLSGIGAG
jgi:hypothetical protein